jgi:DNA-binding transcriptional MerR regulator
VHAKAPDSDDMVRSGEAARQAGITAQQLQYYCMVGLVRPSALSPGGQRLFDRRTVQRITMIRLLNESGYTLRSIREIFLNDRSAKPRRKDARPHGD